MLWKSRFSLYECSLLFVYGLPDRWYLSLYLDVIDERIQAKDHALIWTKILALGTDSGARIAFIEDLQNGHKDQPDEDYKYTKGFVTALSWSPFWLLFPLLQR